VKLYPQVAGCVKKKPWIFDIYIVYQVLTRNGHDVDPTEDTAPEKIPFLKYTSVASCDVERSFSAYKHILSDKRQSMTPENMEKILIVYCT
jgi:hypothetical protein